MADPKLLVICGSLRAGSLNRKLLDLAVNAFGPAEVTYANIRFPLYDGDLEDAEGIPAAVQTLHAQMQDADAIVIATPEYNGNISGVLKNALDWVSRVKPMPMGNTPVAIMSATGGRTGGVMTQNSLRQCLTPFQPMVLQGPPVAVALAAGAFEEDGTLKDERYTKAVQKLMDKLRAII
ncbi:NADPH-dependent FMN reductase [Neptunicoccus cionae]|uniref:NADPH-dependent FMN reductase n=1 Tax=Neptunicoccus cionae TaxID=2035344 RepID=UPI000C78272F|nr:NAD(P)H-dependent oxidoreductase [Amylibacter cionae]PLS20005.1 NADPH-dependent FMN reductase [Amylibacter cionae]